MRAIFFDHDFKQLIKHSKLVTPDDVNSRVIQFNLNSISTVAEDPFDELTIFPPSIITGEFTFKQPFLFVLVNETYIKIKKLLETKLIQQIEITVNSKEMYINIDYTHDHHTKNEIFILPEINKITL